VAHVAPKKKKPSKRAKPAPKKKVAPKKSTPKQQARAKIRAIAQALKKSAKALRAIGPAPVPVAKKKRQEARKRSEATRAARDLLVRPVAHFIRALATQGTREIAREHRKFARARTKVRDAIGVEAATRAIHRAYEDWSEYYDEDYGFDYDDIDAIAESDLTDGA